MTMRQYTQVLVKPGRAVFMERYCSETFASHIVAFDKRKLPWWQSSWLRRSWIV